MRDEQAYYIPAEQLAAHSSISVTILPDLPSLFLHFADSILMEIRSNNQVGRTTRLILPVGPVGQYPLLAERTLREQISWRNVHVFLMDEYCDWQGRRISHEHPLSFLGFAMFLIQRKLTASARKFNKLKALTPVMAAWEFMVTSPLTSRQSAVGLR